MHYARQGANGGLLAHIISKYADETETLTNQRSAEKEREIVVIMVSFRFQSFNLDLIFVWNMHAFLFLRASTYYISYPRDYSNDTY
jgi:hypothetical protein